LLTVLATYIHENQWLNSSVANGLASNATKPPPTQLRKPRCLATSRTPNAVVKAVVFDSRGLEMPDHFGLFRKKPGYCAFGRVNHAMAVVH
jgi:hypothetical protein